MKLFNNINTQHIKKALFILVVYIIYIGLFNGYNPYLPSLPFYPNNETELLEVEKAVANRTPNDVAFFHKTNKSVVEAFVHHVPETREQLTIIETKQTHIILFFKYLINRRRPYQLNPDLNIININTAQTPAFPAGHAYQAQLLAKTLSKRYPEKTQLLYDIALQCDYCRIKAGIHYPSDGEFARKLVEWFN